MAKGKVHMLTGTVQVGDGPVEARVHCNQRHRKLLPLLSTAEWDAVTCARCLTHRPVEALPWWRRVVVWIRGRRS